MHHLNKAQALIELLLAMGLFSLIITGAVILIIDAQHSNLKIIQENKALTYAREGIEAARAIRDQNFLLLVADNEGVGITTQNGYYEFRGNSNTLENLYERRIFITDVFRDINGAIVRTEGTLDPRTKKITSRVSWNTRQIELITYLTHWQGRDWSDTTVSEFNQGNYNQTEVDPSPEPPIDNGLVKTQVVYTDSGFFSSTDLGNHANKVYVNGNYAYVAVNRANRGLQIVDITDIGNPRSISGVDIGDTGLAVEVSGNYAFATSDRDSESFVVVDISDPSNPRAVRRLNISNDDGHELEIVGNYAFIANDNDSRGFTVVDISNPTAPFVVAQRNIREEGSDIVISGNYAYVAVKHDTYPLAIIDISNPVNPQVIRSFDSGSHSHGGIDINGNYLYIASHGNPDLTILDVVAPANPRIVGTLEFTTDIIKDLTYKNNILYVALDNQANGLATIDVTNPSMPRLSYQLTISGKGTGTFATQSNVFMTTQTNNRGLIILETTREGFANSGDFTSRIFDSGSSQTLWRTLSWTNIISPGGNIRLHIRTAASNNQMESALWVGHDGTSTSYYTASPSKIITAPGAGTQFIQYKAYFTSDGNSSPELEEVQLNYIP